MTVRARLALLWAAMAALVVVGVVAHLLAPAPGRADATAVATTVGRHVSLTINDGACGGPWTAPKGGGEVDFSVTDAGTTAEVYLQDPTTDQYFFELEGVDTGVTVSTSAVLGNGSYRLVCFPNDMDPALGPITKVDDASGVHDATPGVAPVTEQELIPIAQQYQKWVAGQLPALRTHVRALRRDLAAGKVSAAKAEWLDAHLRYETLGAAYDAFGDFDGAINGMPASGHKARDDPDLTGFHKVEALLWSGAPLAKTAAAAQTLDSDVGRLQTYFATSQVQASVIALRAHEIVENAIQFELTGRSDAGSHTNLATIAANLDGARTTLGMLEPLLASRYTQLPQTKTALAAAVALVRSYDVDGRWTPLDALTTTQREHLDAALDGLVELLAPVAAICDFRYEVSP